MQQHCHYNTDIVTFEMKAWFTPEGEASESDHVVNAINI